MGFSFFRRWAAADLLAPVKPTDQPKGKSRLAKNAALAALCCTTLVGFEGMRTVAYRDVIGIPTICVGETKNVRMGMTISKHECETKLLTRLSEDFAPAMERCAIQPMDDDQYRANLSLIYNIGAPKYCSSTVVRLWNAGDRRGSCEAFLLFNKTGRPLREDPGLTRRRKAERALCLKGI